MTEHTNDTAQAYPPPGATVNGADALDLLPVGTVVQDRDTSEWTRLHGAWTWSGMRRTSESMASVYGPLTVVSVPEQATGGTIPDCCDHLDMEQGHCHACYDSGHAHDPDMPCPPAATLHDCAVDETAGGAETTGAVEREATR